MSCVIFFILIENVSFNSSDLYEFAGVGCIGPGGGDLIAWPHDRDALSWRVMIENNHLEREKINNSKCFLTSVTAWKKNALFCASRPNIQEEWKTVRQW